MRDELIDQRLKILNGSKIRLELLEHSHKNALYEAAQDETIWTYTGTSAFGQNFYPWFENANLALKNQEHFPFVIHRLEDNKIIGSTRFYDFSLEHQRLAIGYTWLIPEAWGSHANTESKLLLLTAAFEDCSINRVEFTTDSRNLRSQAAIKKIGGIQEGILRQHMVLKTGYIRDTILFSIIKADWPQVKSNLLQRLNQY